MPSILIYLSGPEFSFHEACEFARLDPRRVTVWLQRSDPLRMPVPTGVMISERKRVFSGLEVLQLCVLGRLIESRMDVATAALIAKAATDRFAHEDKVGAQLSRLGTAALIDVGLFVEQAGKRKIHPVALREAKLLPVIRSIKERYAEGIECVTDGFAPETHTFVPIGDLAHQLIGWITARAED